MSRFSSLIKQDVRFQFRHGFYFVYGIVTVIYIAILKALSPNISNVISPIIIFIDPSFIGFFFIGAILFFEKEQRVKEAIFVTPVSNLEYILSKAISLTLLTLLVVFLILIFTHGLFLNWFYIILGVSLTSTLFIFVGILLTDYLKTITDYLVVGGLIMSPFSAPIVEYLGLNSSILYYILPTTGSLRLISGGILGGLSLWDFLYSFLYLGFLNLILLKILLKRGNR